MGRHDQKEAVHPVSDDPAVLDRAQGRGVHNNVVVEAARLLEDLAEPRRLEDLVRARRSMSGLHHGQVERRPEPGYALQG